MIPDEVYLSISSRTFIPVDSDGVREKEKLLRKVEKRSEAV